MNCPDCNCQLKTSQFLEKKKNLNLAVSYCPCCGGFWLDSSTANSLTYDDLQKIEQSFKTSSPSLPSSPERICPQCQLPLQQMEAESIPPEVVVFNCKKCNKKWFPSGQLKKFKKAQEVKVEYFKKWRIPLKSIFAILLPIVIVLPLAFRFFKPEQKQEAVIYLSEPEGAGEGEKIEGECAISQPEVEVVDGVEVVITFSTSIPCYSFIEYGLTKDELEILPVNNQLVDSHRSVISGLLPNKTYWFKITAGVGERKKTSSFHSFVIEPE